MTNLVKLLIFQVILLSLQGKDLKNLSAQDHHFIPDTFKAPTKGPVLHPLRPKPFQRRDYLV